MNYNDKPGLRWSALREILTSPKHYRHRAATPRKDTAAMRFGRIVHCAVLEPERFAREAIAFPAEHLTKSGAVSTAAKTVEWLASLADDAIVLSASEREACTRIVSELQAHEETALWLHEAREREVEVQWTETVDGVDVPLKAKADAYCPRLGLLLDLKIVGGMGAFNIRKCEAKITNERWYGQAGHYAKGLEHSGRRVESVGWICVEATEPHDIIPFEATPDLFVAGRECADDAVARYAHAVGADRWDGCAPKRVMADVPVWMIKDEGNTADEELEFEEDADV